MADLVEEDVSTQFLDFDSPEIRSNLLRYERLQVVQSFNEILGLIQTDLRSSSSAITPAVEALDRYIELSNMLRKRKGIPKDVAEWYRHLQGMKQKSDRIQQLFEELNYGGKSFDDSKGVELEKLQEDLGSDLVSLVHNRILTRTVNKLVNEGVGWTKADATKNRRNIRRARQ